MAKRPPPAGYRTWKDYMAYLRSLKGRRRNPGRPHGLFRRCVKDVKQSLKKYRRKGDPKAICGASLSRAYPRKKNPLAVLNPPGRLFYKAIEVVAGVHKSGGRYEHTFGTKVKAYALDNGNVLLVGGKNTPLWEEIER